MERLRDLMGTQFMTVAHTSQLSEVLSKASGPLDLRNCKFTPPAYEVLRQYFGKIEFHDTYNPEINKILEHNNVAHTKVVESEPLNIDFETFEEFLGIYKNIDIHKVYNLSNMKDANTLKCRSAAVLFMLHKPAVMFDLQEKAINIFEYVRDSWLKTRSRNYDAYWEVDGMSIWKRDVKDGEVYIPGVGTISEETYVREYLVLPYEFGTVDLYGEPDFKLVWDTALSTLIPKKREKLTIKKFIEVR